MISGETDIPADFVDDEKLLAELEATKGQLLQMQNAAIDLAKQLEATKAQAIEAGGYEKGAERAKAELSGQVAALRAALVSSQQLPTAAVLQALTSTVQAAAEHDARVRAAAIEECASIAERNHAGATAYCLRTLLSTLAKKAGT